MMIVLNSKQTLQCLPIGEAIDAIENVMKLYANKQTLTPHRHVLQTPYGGPTLFMPSILSPHSETESSIGIKVVSVRPNNSISVPAVIMLLDGASGMPKLLFNATDCTAIRTASCSAVATKYLAKSDSKVLGVFGAGQQGKFHVLACSYVAQNVDTVYIWNRSITRANQLRDDLVALDMNLPFVFGSEDIPKQSTKRVINVRVSTDANEVASVSNIICTCTNTNTPLFDGKVVQPGTHINCIGSYRKDMQEVDSYIVAHSRMIADDAPSVWIESGDVNNPLNEGLITKDHILLDNLGLLNEQSATLVRTSDTDITMFKCVGMAAQDVAMADVVWSNVQSLKDQESYQQVDLS
jgi:ornithine cyclodeaminase/alanine dehydrogenase-like protein (mu-crystallin family)